MKSSKIVFWLLFAIEIELFCLICNFNHQIDVVSAQHVHYSRFNLFHWIYDTYRNSRCFNCRCGSPNMQNEWLGHNYLQPHEFPWLANVQVKGNLLISATLLNDRFVISSANLLLGITPYDVKVILGMINKCHPDTTSTIFSVTNIFIHPEFLHDHRHNDISLLKLASIVPYARQMLPICLPTPGMHYLGRVATIAIWKNQFSFNETFLPHCLPRRVDLPILKSCWEPTLTTQGCIGIYGALSGICKEDTGAGIFVDSHRGYFELIGVLSDKQDCDIRNSVRNSNYLGGTFPMFTRISNHMDWILSHTSDGCFCSKLF